MTARILFSFLLLAGTAQAQQFTNLVWPPRETGAREVFGRGGTGTALDAERLAVAQTRVGENPFVRMYAREGLNWIEDGRLTAGPRTPVDVAVSDFGASLDVDGDAVVVGGAGVSLFRRVRARDWGRAVPIDAPQPLTGTEFGRCVTLDGDWMAVGTTDAVYLLQAGVNGWTLVQELPSNQPTRLELDGPNLMLVDFERVQMFRHDGATWNPELALLWANADTDGPDTPADLDGDRLGVLRAQMFRSFERTDAGWELTGSFGTFSDGVAFTGDRAYLTEISPGGVQVIERGLAGWAQVTKLVTPEPTFRFGFGAARVLATDSLVAVHSNSEVVEHMEGNVTTYATGGARATLLASHNRMALDVGGTLRLTLDAGVANAGKRFLLRGSMTGTSPGFLARGVHIPLERRNDLYFDLSRVNGRLDFAGQATVDIVLPATAPGDPLGFIKDRTLHHAFFLWSTRTGVTDVSNVALTGIVGRLR